MPSNPSWNPAYSCKIPGVDRQHQELIQFFADYLENHEAGQKGQEKETLSFLRTYIMKHFSAEEKMMKKYYYPNLEKHKISHREYIAEYKGVLTEFKETGNLLQLQVSLKGMLDWFIAHIQEFDFPMGDEILSTVGKTRIQISSEKPEQLSFQNKSYNKLKRLNQAGVLNTYEQNIDTQHIELIDQFSDFIELSEKDKATPKSLEMLKFLNNYIKNHFQNEQNLMLRYSYPLAKLHQKAHAQYQNDFKKIIANFAQGKNFETLTHEITHMLDWFLYHIK
ncbi:MAG: hemerythrin domain-containing protein [SAR324 cluster bacterium]|nr:hemerythrin domain-containing protein [SAR324 cluster bacterium]